VLTRCTGMGVSVPELSTDQLGDGPDLAHRAVVLSELDGVHHVGTSQDEVAD